MTHTEIYGIRIHSTQPSAAAADYLKPHWFCTFYVILHKQTDKQANIPNKYRNRFY